jgi:hypothetical protein
MPEILPGEMGLAEILAGFIEYKPSETMDRQRHLLNIFQYALSIN